MSGSRALSKREPSRKESRIAPLQQTGLSSMANKQEGFRRLIVLLNVLGGVFFLAWAVHMGYSWFTGTTSAVVDGGIAVLLLGGVMFGLAYILGGFSKTDN